MNEILNFIDDCYIINLDKRPDRWEEITNHLKDLNITKYQRFSAVENVEHPLIGSSMSHYNVIKNAYLNNQKYIMVLEDDCIFIDPYRLNYSDILGFLKNNYFDVFYLGITVERHCMKYVNSYIGKVTSVCTTAHCVICNVDSIYAKMKSDYPDENQMIDFFEANAFNHGIISLDGWYNNMNLVRYFSVPTVADQRKSYSNVLNVVVNYKMTQQAHLR